MDTTITIWICVAAAMAAIIIYRMLHRVIHLNHGAHNHRLIELGSEREELWIPGDMSDTNIDSYDDAEDF